LGEGVIFLLFQFSKSIGAYGKVYEGLCRGFRVAVKVLKASGYDDSALSDMKREMGLLRYVDFCWMRRGVAVRLDAFG
jgi:hypothetical protein